MGTVINVAGTARSGGSILHLMLGNAPDALACGEVMNHFRSFMKDQEQTDCVCGADPCPVWSTLESVPEDQIFSQAFDRLKVDFVIDSSRAASWLLDVQRWSHVHSFHVVNLLVWKDPVELGYSFWKRGHDAMFWRDLFVKYCNRFFNVGLPLLTVQYGDLLQDPKTTLSQVCDAVGMPYFEGKERFWEKQHHLYFANVGVRRQLRSGNTVLLSETVFPPDFEPHRARIQEAVAGDAEVQRLLTLLKCADVSHSVNGPRQPQSFIAPKIYPLWYRAHQLKQMVHRRFPRKLVSSDPADVATNPQP